MYISNMCHCHDWSRIDRVWSFTIRDNTIGARTYQKRKKSENTWSLIYSRVVNMWSVASMQKREKNVASNCGRLTISVSDVASEKVQRKNLSQKIAKSQENGASSSHKNPIKNFVFVGNGASCAHKGVARWTCPIRRRLCSQLACICMHSQLAHKHLSIRL
jgi:hypothetical protein